MISLFRNEHYHNEYDARCPNNVTRPGEQLSIYFTIFIYLSMNMMHAVPTMSHAQVSNYLSYYLNLSIYLSIYEYDAHCPNNVTRPGEQLSSIYLIWGGGVDFET